MQLGRLALACVALAATAAHGAVVLRGSPVKTPTVAQGVSEAKTQGGERQQSEVASAQAKPALEEHTGQIRKILSHLQAASGTGPRYVLAQLSSRFAGPVSGPVSSYIAADQTPLTLEQVEQQEEKQEAQQKAMVEVVSLLTTLIYLGLVCLVAKYYIGQREAAYSVPIEGETDEDSFKEFRAGICQWYQRPDICLWVWCCPAIRWGDSMWTMGSFRSFWFAMVLFFGVSSLVGNTADGMGVIVLAILGAGYRQELRERFQMSRQGGSTYAEDFCLYCWCMCCAVAQEARHVEEAVRSGHPAVARKASAAAVPGEA